MCSTELMKSFSAQGTAAESKTPAAPDRATQQKKRAPGVSDVMRRPLIDQQPNRLKLG